MNSAPLLLTVGIVLRKCGHPRTEENTYVVTEFQKGRPVETRRCKACTQKRAKLAYERRMGRAPAIVRPAASGFCAHCTEGRCGRVHAAAGIRCLRPASSRAEAHVCACGAAFALTWKRFLDRELKNERRHSFQRRPAP